MTRRAPSQYDFSKQLFDELLLSELIGARRQTFPRRRKIKHIDIHHMTVPDSSNGQALQTCVDIWKKRQASAHYGIDNVFVAQYVYDNAEAWGNANSLGNQEGIVIEHANSKMGPTWTISDKTIETSVKLVAWLHVTHKLGRPTSGGFGSKTGTIRTHSSFMKTECPGPYFKKIWNSYVKQVQAYYDKITTATTPTKPPESEVTHKLRVLHWNIAGSDTVNGYGKRNATRGDDVADWVKEIGYDIFMACEAGQKPLVNGITSVLKLKPYNRRAKAIWAKAYVKLIASRRSYSDSSFAYLKETKWGSAAFGSSYGHKYATLEVHLDYRKPAKQAKQLQSIFRKFIKDCDDMGIPRRNILVGGDFNPDLNGSSDDPFTALADWNFEDKGRADLPTFLDGRRLDGFLAHKNAKVTVTRYSRKDLSDHYPLKAEITLQ